MYCGECGAKVKKTDLFCGECGAQIKNTDEKNDTNKTENIKIKTDKKPMSKKQRTIITVVAAIILILGIGYKVGSNITSPKAIAKKYIQATIDKNVDVLYNYLELDGDKTFVTKDIYKKLLESDKSSSNIANFVIEDVKYGTGKLNVTVGFKYTKKDSSVENSGSVVLLKQKTKKYFIFDNWKISSDYRSIDVLENYTIKVVSGTKVSYAGIELTKKYKDENNSTTTTDVYVLPQVFGTKTTIKATFKNGIEIEENVTPYSDNSSHTVSFNENNISDNMKSKLLEVAGNSLKTVYENAINEKAFTEIKSKFEHENIDLTNIESAYNDLVNELKEASFTLKSISFTKLELSDLSLTNEGELELDVKAYYDYSIDYINWDDEVKTKSDSDYSYMTVILTQDKGTYYTVNLKDLEDYFSRY